ncbi:hypothetical protein AGMMS49587_08310 [Spirochaetia bacterium]|nr:hypothetical protein AGMMS49587_08310 [Spirochaetia bacterium]
MKMDEIFEKVVALAAKKFGVNKSDTSKNTSFCVFGCDGENKNEFIVHDVGADFDLNISTDEAWDISTIGSLCEVIKSKQYQF